MPTIKELYEKRATLAQQMREHAKEPDKWDAEAAGKWEALNKDYDGLSDEIRKLEAVEKVATRLADIDKDMKRVSSDMKPADFNGQESRERPAITEETRALALQGWMRAQFGVPINRRNREAMELTGVRRGREYTAQLLDTRGVNHLRETRAGMSTTVALGGYTIPEGFVKSFEVALLNFSGPRQVADVLRTDSGNDLPWPTGNDTSNTGAMLAEETTIGATVNPAVGVKTFKAWKMSSKLIQVSPELLQDSAFDMASQVGAWLGERIARCENTYYTTGADTTEPAGCVTDATLGVTTASATAITSDEVLDLIYSVDIAYRTGPKVCFAMNDSVVKYLRKLKDGEGRYIWQAGMAAGEPDVLHGYPVYKFSAMASSITNNAKTMLYGDFSKFKIRDVTGLRMRRLVERYADTDQEGFVGFHRTDSHLVDAGTHPLKYMLQHA